MNIVTELKYDVIFVSKWFKLLFLGAFLLMFGFSLPYEVSLFLYLISSIFIIWSVFSLFEKTILRIDGVDFIVETRSLFKIKCKYYNIKRMQKVLCQQNVESMLNSGTRVYLGGMLFTPDALKKSYFHKEIVSFYYNGKLVEIGKWRKKFGGWNLVEELNNIIGED